MSDDGRVPFGNPMNAPSPTNDDDLPAEIDFSGGTRGKFHRPNAKLNLPVFLDAEVQADVVAFAAAKGMTLSDIVNDLLRGHIAILKAAK